MIAPSHALDADDHIGRDVPKMVASRTADKIVLQVVA